MPNTRDLPQQIGLNQNQLADLIGCSKVQLAMAETGQRNLPAASVAAWYRLSTVIETILNNTASTRGRGNKTTTLGQKMIKKLSLQLKSRELKVEKIKQSLQQSEWQLQLAEQFNVQPFLPDDGIAPLRMQILQRTAERELDEQAAELLQHQLAIAGIKAQLEILKEF
jgi:transcriptional regulator with XRE-family HTH domain